MAGVRAEGRAFLHPTAVLFNGGVMKAGELRTRVMDVLAGWVAGEDGKVPRELPGADLDLAVAKGGAVYGRVRQGKGIRIRGGTARAYYVGVEIPMPAVPGMPPPVAALCVAPMGMEEGTSAELPQRELNLVVGERAQFRFFSSSARREDAVGTVVEREAELEELPPIEAELPAGEGEAGQQVPVTLRTHVTEIGTLEISAVDAQQREWRVEFNLRQAEADGGP
jgi:hypothetical protein